MSGEVGKLAGRQTGFVANDFAKSPSSGPALEPGKRTLVQSVSLGNAYGDRGGRCDGKDSTTPGCFLASDARRRYVQFFLRDVTVAQENFKAACTSLQVKELLKKEEELDWFTALVMDFASTFVLGAAAKVIKRLRDAGADALLEKGVMMIDRGADAALYDRADQALRGITDKRIDAWARTGFYSVKKGAQGVAKDAKNADARHRKSDVDAYLNALKNQADQGYSKFVTTALYEANDAEFAVLYEGMQPEHHQQDAYEAALETKLEAYKRSRVRDIGRKTTKDESRMLNVQRETRVVWVKNFQSEGRRLYYQYQEAGIDSVRGDGEDPGLDWGPAWVMQLLPAGYGVIGKENKLGGPVPDEFAEIALQRSEALYGPTKTLDPATDYLKSQGLDPTPRPAGANVPRVDLTQNPYAPSFALANNTPAGQPTAPTPSSGPNASGSVSNSPTTASGPQPNSMMQSYPPGSVFNNNAGSGRP